MLFVLTLWMLAVTQTAEHPPTGAVPSRSYLVWVSVDDGECRYWLTDAGLDAKQLKDALSENYDPANGLEVLTSNDTPSRCVTKARRSAARAGFATVRVRLGTEKDRALGIP